MGETIKPTPIAGNLGTAVVQACFDTGSGASFLRRGVAERVATAAPTPSPRVFATADGERRLEAREVVQLDVTIKGVTVPWTFYVVDRLSDDMIIGHDMMQRWKIKVDPESEDVDIDPSVIARLRI